MAKQKTYIAIDLKSFYASVECKERNRDPLTTNLVVADKSRTEKTICLAVSPSLKSYGIPGRPRLFEVVQKVKEANNTRRWKALNRTFTGSSDDSTELNANPALEIDYIVAPPRMAYYLEYSTKIYSVYLKYIAPEDIFPYSIDEVFIDATNYLNTYQMTARELAMTMIQDVLKTTGIYRLRSTEEEAGGGRRKIRTGKAYARSNAEYQKEVWQECCVEGNEP